MSTSTHTAGRITGNVVGAVHELRTPDGQIILSFLLQGTKKSTAMRGGTYNAYRTRAVFVCHALDDHDAVRLLTVGHHITIDVTAIPSSTHFPHDSSLPPTVEQVTTIYPFAAF
jgi:hypothetical protein